jgi:hypothetical protein
MRGRISFVVIMFVSFASQAVAQQANLCDGVQCSGHGRCIVVRGEPACACEAGSTPDATGLNCNVAAPVVAQVMAAPVPVPAPVSQPVVVTVPVAVAPQPVPTPALAPVPVPSRPDRMLRIRLNAPFMSESERPYRDLRIVGMAYMYAGLPLIILSIANVFTGFVSEDTGLAIDVISGVLVLTGAVFIMIGFFRQRHIRREVMAGQVAYDDILRTAGYF